MEDASEDIYEKMRSVFKRGEKFRQETGLKIIQEGSKRQLEKNIDKRIRTTFVGILDILEKNWGELWGHKQPIETLTEDEAQFRREWDEIRNLIFNHGNKQIRYMNSEMEQYSITWTPHKYNIPIIPLED